MADSSQTLRGVSVDGKKQTRFSQILGRIGTFFNPIKDIRTTDKNPTDKNYVTNSVSRNQIDLQSFISQTSIFANGLFGVLAQSQSTKQAQYQLESLNKEREIAIQKGEIDYKLKQLELDIELKKQELTTSLKDTSKKNITTIAVVVMSLFFSGIVLYLMLRKSPEPQ